MKRRAVVQLARAMLVAPHGVAQPGGKPVRIGMLINLKAATQLGTKIPPSVLVRADRVIE